ncbi:DUF2971 domain-containing protein [Gimesia maris]|uniref:DUF2971 domain-containing protein n=1 Tax=Gimesia maris TaxID=122 RepID=UPI0032EF63B0
MQKLPPTVFKYESFSSLSLQNLKTQSIYFSSPKDFNDPYDCSIKSPIADPPPDELKKVVEYYLTKTDYPESERQRFLSLPENEIVKIVVPGVQKAVDETRENILMKNGITCFSECVNNLLMWSHYGGKGRGFCTEFRTEYPPFNKIRKVRYRKEMPRINISNILGGKNYDKVFEDLVCVKSKSWKYEKEWRAIHNEARTLFTYETKALKAVYFGPEMEIPAIEIICLILRGQNTQVEFYKGTRSETEFKVDFKPFTYKTFLDSNPETRE